VFSLQPGTIAAGSALGAIAVSELDPLDNLIDDNETDVAFTVPACDGNALLGNATMVHGVATLTPEMRLYTPTAPASLQVTGQAGALSALSSAFKVNPNGALIFAEGFEGCRP
jgi:hypothetical protein